MTPSGKQRRPLPLRLKIALISFLALLVGIVCRLLPRPPLVTCYVPPPPTDTPEPFVTCYTQLPPTATLTPTPPTSPLPTPTPTATPEEARRLLLGRLLAEGRFPQDVVQDLE